jgi:hypothetical protein
VKAESSGIHRNTITELATNRGLSAPSLACGAMDVGVGQLLKRVPGAVPAVRRSRRSWQRFRWHHIPGLRHGYPPSSDFYQSPDWWVVDYKLYSPSDLPRDLLPGLPLRLRGPAPGELAPGRYIACVGAAQTFGRFCEEPFPALLSKDLGIPAVNLGFGGAGPQLFPRHPELIRLMNESALVVLQVMSARNEDNSLFQGGLGSLKSRSTGEPMRPEAAYGRLLASGDQALVTSVVGETRETWIASYEKLLSLFEVPTVLLWFSVRKPRYTEKYDSVQGIFGDFPHLVNEEMIETIASHCDAYVECVSVRGRPQQLRSRFTGKPTRVLVPGRRPLSENTYYPSPEMHQDAAAVLRPICRDLLDRRLEQLRS